MKYLKNADLIIQTGDELHYFFWDEGYEICYRTMEVSESYIDFETEEKQKQYAAEILQSDTGAEIVDGELPGWNRCSFCEEWTNYGGRCERCTDYVYRHN